MYFYYCYGLVSQNVVYFYSVGNTFNLNIYINANITYSFQPKKKKKLRQKICKKINELKSPYLFRHHLNQF